MKILYLCTVLTACGGPAIRSFDLKPVPVAPQSGARSSTGELRICAGEAVAARWDLKGEPAMLLRVGNPRYATHEEPEDVDPLAPDTLEVTLVASPGPKEKVNTKLVMIFPDSSHDTVVFKTSLSGNLLVASGEKGEAPTRRFVVERVTNPLARALSVEHENRTMTIGANSGSEGFKGTQLGGHWSISAPMSTAEQANPSSRPTKLGVEVDIRCVAGAQ